MKLKLLLLLNLVFSSTLLASDKQPNAVLLIGIDGFRFDLLQQYKLPNLQKLADKGVTTAGMIPVMPSKTFPNFYAMASGLYPNKNGVVANTTYDRKSKKLFTMSSAQVDDFFQGEPIWITAEKHGITAANMFWVGSEAPFDGKRSTHWYKYDGRIANRKRVEQVLTWLDLPLSERPGFISLYFSALDSASHAFGTQSKQREHAAKSIDHQLGYLFDEIEKRQLENLHIIIVGDHGMEDLSPDRVINIDQLLKEQLPSYDDIDYSGKWVFSPQLQGSNKGNAVMATVFTDGKQTSDQVYQQLHNSHPNMKVYQYPNFPEHYHLDHPTRYPDLLLVPDAGWLISKTTVPFSKTYVATHGFDNQIKNMHAGFIGFGKQFKSGVKVDTFENTHVYCLAAEILALPWQGKDCSKQVVQGFLKN